MTINALIVTTRATYVSFQGASWREAAQSVLDYADIGLARSTINDASPVFMRDISEAASLLEQHTVGSLRRDLESGKI